MFVFKLWGHFGAFRDPLTITQNITFSIPPKTTIGGMLAAVLGIDYDNYFNDENYFDFEYSVVLNNKIMKKSFSQNYVEDYTKKSELKQNNLVVLNEELLLLASLQNEKKELLERKKKLDINNNSSLLKFSDNNSPLSKKEEKRLLSIDKKISKITEKVKKQFVKVNDDISNKMTKPKPIRRELLINPNFTIFINNYKYEKETIQAMKKHHASFMFYMGNSEFPANYELLDCIEVDKTMLNNVDSFTKSLDKISFEAVNKYSILHFATKVTQERKYMDYQKIVFGNFGKQIFFKEPIEGYSIKLPNQKYNCEFI